MNLFAKALKKSEKILLFNNFFSDFFVYSNSLKKSKDEVKKCFVRRDEENVISDENLLRIIKAYSLSKEQQQGISSIFKVSNEWDYLYKFFMGGIIDVLEKGDMISLRKLYKNFMRENFSRGLHGLHIDMEKNFFLKDCPSKLHSKLYLNDSIYRYELWKSSIGNNENIQSLFMPEYGNSYGYYIGNTYIRTGAEYLHYYATAIKNLFDHEPKQKRTIVEIGGGYGGMGYFLNKNFNNITYVDYDLPENMALTSYYLLSCFPEKKIMLYGEDSLDNIKNYDIVILPSFCIDKLEENSVDLVFNSYSLAEMSTESIRYYVDKIRSVSKEYIFHINHTNKSTSLNSDNFGFDNGDDFRLIYKAKAMWNMYRNFRCDEYEYLYKKKK